MRVTRGLFRLWLVLSVVWIGGAFVVMAYKTRELLEWLLASSVVGIVPPLLVLALGSALVWAFRGFR
jgi:hypothetical protein